MNKILLMLLALLSFNTVLSEPKNPDKYIAESAVSLFAAACLKFYPDPMMFEQWVSRNKFDVIPAEFTKGLLRDPGAVAYSVNNNGVRYALVAERDNLCSVFVKEVNLEYATSSLHNLRSGLSSSLAEKESMSEKKLNKGVVKTTNIQYSKPDGGVIMTLVISESTSSDGAFQLAMSATSLLRANKVKKIGMQ